MKQTLEEEVDCIVEKLMADPQSNEYIKLGLFSLTSLQKIILCTDDQLRTAFKKRFLDEIKQNSLYKEYIENQTENP